MCSLKKYYAISTLRQSAHTHTDTHPLNFVNALQRNGSRGFSSHFLFWLSQKKHHRWRQLMSWLTHTHSHPHTLPLACNCNKWILKHGVLLVVSMWAWQRHSFQLTVCVFFFSLFVFAGVLQHYNAFWWSPLCRGDFLEGFHLCHVCCLPLPLPLPLPVLPLCLHSVMREAKIELGQTNKSLARSKKRLWRLLNFAKALLEEGGIEQGDVSVVRAVQWQLQRAATAAAAAAWQLSRFGLPWATGSTSQSTSQRVS